MYVAAQLRISWLDSKITSLKSATIYSMGKAHQHDPYMVSKTATQVANEGAAHSGTDAQNYSRELKKYISQIQVVRKSIATNLISGLAVSLATIFGIPFIPLIKDDICIVSGILVLSSVSVLWVGFVIGRSAYKSLKVSLKEDV